MGDWDLSNLHNAMLLGGLVFLVGFGIFQAWPSNTLTMLVTWAVLVMGGLGFAWANAKSAVQKNTLLAWLVLMLAAVLVGFGGYLQWLPVWGLKAPYLPLWVLALALGFFYTGFKTKESIWHGAGVLNLIVLIGLLGRIEWMENISFLLSGIASGVPMILIGFKH